MNVGLRRVAMFTWSSSRRCEDTEWFEQDILSLFHYHTDESIGRSERVQRGASGCERGASGCEGVQVGASGCKCPSRISNIFLV